MTTIEAPVIEAKNVKRTIRVVKKTEHEGITLRWTFNLVTPWVAKSHFAVDRYDSKTRNWDRVAKLVSSDYEFNTSAPLAEEVLVDPSNKILANFLSNDAELKAKSWNKVFTHLAEAVSEAL